MNRDHVRRRRKHCNEECLRRIAEHLCDLDNSSTKEKDRQNGCLESRCCSTSQTVNSVSCGENTSLGCTSGAVPLASDISTTPYGSQGAASTTGCCISVGSKELNTAGACCSNEKMTSIPTSRPCAIQALDTTACGAFLEPQQIPNCCEIGVSSSYRPACVHSASEEHTCESDCWAKPPLEEVSVVSAGGCLDECCGEGSAATLAPMDTKSEGGCCGTSKSDGSPSVDVGGVDECCKTKTDAQTEPAPSACSPHLQASIDHYAAMLKRGQCLCRSVLDQLGFSCCNPIPGYANTSASQRKSKIEKKTLDAPSSEAEMHSRCSYDIHKEKQAGAKLVKSDVKKCSIPSPQNSDIEQAAAREHVVLSVVGMTCTGCSRKMMNILESVKGLSNSRVVFVSGVAEFDLDPNVADKVEDVISSIERKTGFKCSRMISGRQELLIIMSDAASKQMHDAALAGVISIKKEKSNNYSVTYDPAIIGARSVLPQGAKLAPPSGNAGMAESKRRLMETGMSTALAAVLTIPIVVLEWSSNPVPTRIVSIVTLALGTCVQAISIPEFYVGALKSLVYSRVIEMDMLVVISITAAYVYSVTAFGLQEAGIALEQGPFFETSALLITLVLLGRLLSAWARIKAVSAVSLRSLQAETALQVAPDGETRKIDARLLEFGDIIVCPPHSRITTDGEIVSGASEVDESTVTGESLPVIKHVGDMVIAGTINGSGNIHVRLSRLPGANSITDIAGLVETAVASRPRVQELADKVASWFIPTVIGIATVVFCIWIGVAIHVRGRNGGGAVGLAITYSIAVLAISCPCAVGLAVPMVLVIASGVAARAGVIIKAADAIERAQKVTDVVFDKTGTLTKGDLQVVREELMQAPNMQENEVLAMTKALVEGNDHPVSAAVATHILTSSPTIIQSPVKDITSIPGAGIEARYKDSVLRAGNPRWLRLEQHPSVASILQKAMTLFCVSLDNEPILVYGLKSTTRSNAASVISELQRRNISCHIASGDSAAVVADIAHELSISPSQTLACSSPAQKQQYIHSLQATGRKVLFLGDGTNDAVAIAQANVGVQMGSASDVTRAVSDVVLLSHNLEGVLLLLNLSQAAVHRIIFNFGWSAVYNLFAILLAAGAFVDFRIPPSYAGLGEIVSVLPVILIAGSLAFGRRTQADTLLSRARTGT